MDTASFSRVVLTKLIRKQILEIAQDRKKKPVLIVNEASILRLQVLVELHTTTQFQRDSKPILPIILAGQNDLADLLIYRTSLPLASRVVAWLSAKTAWAWGGGIQGSHGRGGVSPDGGVRLSMVMT
ncbi:hypothetical protein DFAR_2220006 [Desulfarculales bacterium]